MTQQPTKWILGFDAEITAIKYLKKRGFKIIAHRFKTNYGEIDVIGFDGKTIVAFEIKKRQTLDYARAAISVKQLRRIENAFEHFRATHPKSLPYLFRIDALYIVGNEIVHIENVSFC